MDSCSLDGALGAAEALSSGSVAIYLQSASATNSYNGESNSFYSFNDPGLDVTIEPDPSLGAGAVSVFDARYLPGSSILTLSGSGSLTLNDVQMQNATSTTSGGALHITSSLSVTCNSCVFTNNQTVANSNGGAIGVDNVVAGDLTVNDSTFSDNWAFGVGGAIGEYASNGTMTITNSTFTGNQGYYGGAIGEGANGGGTLNVSGSTFTNNSANIGGGIDNADIGGSSSAVVQYSTFVDNTAEATGGAIASNLNFGGGNLVVLRSTIDDGAGTTPAVAAGGGTTVFAGSLIAGSQSSLCAGTISDAGYNVESDASASCGFTQSSDAVAGSDPGLAKLADNGGATLTEQVSAASSAANSIPSTPSTLVIINATPYTLCANPDVDQTGVAQATAGGCSRGALDATHLATSSVPSVTAPLTSSSATQSFSLAAWEDRARAVTSSRRRARVARSCRRH